jgi:hypothetical protein
MIHLNDIPPSMLDGIRDTIANDLDAWTAKGLTLDECEYAYLTGLDQRMAEIPAKLAKQLRPIYVQLIETAIDQRRAKAGSGSTSPGKLVVES